MSRKGWLVLGIAVFVLAQASLPLLAQGPDESATIRRSLPLTAGNIATALNGQAITTSYTQTGTISATQFINTGKEGMILGGGTTAERAVSPSAGTLRYDSTLGKLSYYTTGWYELPSLTTNNVFTGTVDFQNAAGITVGKDSTGGTPNVTGTIKLIGKGDNAFYSTFATSEQTADAGYTLPTALPAADSWLTSSSAGALGWTTASLYPTLAGGETFTVAPIIDTGDNGAATPTTWSSHIRGLKFQNDTVSTSGTPIQDPPAFRFEGHAWDTDTGAGPGQDDKWKWSIYPDQASGSTTSSSLQFVSMKSPGGVDATPVVGMSLSNSGAVTATASVSASFLQATTANPGASAGAFYWSKTVTNTGANHGLYFDSTYNQASGSASSDMLHVFPVITAISGGTAGVSNYFANFGINTTPWYQFAFGSTASTGSFNASSASQTGVLFAPVVAQTGTAGFYALDVAPTYTSMGSGTSADVRIKHDALAATAKTGLLITNTTAATSGVPVQYSPDIKLVGSANITGGELADTHTWTIRNVPENASTTTSKLSFMQDTSGTPVEKVSFSNTGGVSLQGGISAYNSVFKMSAATLNALDTYWLYLVSSANTKPLGFYNAGIADSGTAIAFISDTTNALSTSGAKLWSWKSGGVPRACLMWFGASSLTDATMTKSVTGAIATGWSKYTWTAAQVVSGRTAAGTSNIKVCTLPAKTIVKRAYIITNAAATGVDSPTVSLGRTGADYIDYLVATAPGENTIIGNALAEVGTNLKDAHSSTALVEDFAVFADTTSTVDIYCQFTCDGDPDINQWAGGTGTVYLETYTLP